MLGALCDLYDRLEREGQIDLPRFGYSTQKISFKLVLRPDGALFDVQDLREQDGKRRGPRQLVLPGGAKPPGAVTEESVKSKVQLLRGASSFVLGIIQAAKRPPHFKLVSNGEFEAFREFHLGAEEDICDPQFSAVCRFLESWEPDSGLDRVDWVEVLEGQGVFQILGEECFVHERPKVEAWWDDRAQAGAEWTTGQCLVTGSFGRIAELHEPKLKSIEGANSSGATLVSFNLGAFKSYGKTQSFNSPVSPSAAFRYATALNVLLDGALRTTHRIRLGADTVVFWTDRPSRTEDVFAQFCSTGYETPQSIAAEDEATRQKLELFLRALREGRSAYTDIDDEPDRTSFFLLALAGNAGRAVVRWFHRETVTETLDRLRQHVADCEIVGPRGYPAFSAVPPLWVLLDQTCPRRNGKPDRDKIPPLLAAPLLRAVLTGGRYPMALYQSVLRRLPVEGVDHPRACILKAFLTRNFGKEISVSLNRDRLDPPYRLGRLFAALEKTQTDALGRGLNRTLRDAFYGGASTAPATVFPRLLRTFQHHLSKLEGGWRVNRERLVEEVVEPLEGFPAHLSLIDQGSFALGYYHQMQDFYAGKRAHEAAEPEGGAA